MKEKKEKKKETRCAVPSPSKFVAPGYTETFHRSTTPTLIYYTHTHTHTETVRSIVQCYHKFFGRNENLSCHVEKKKERKKD